MKERERIEFGNMEVFPIPRWARVTAFVGLYALALAGMVGVEQNIQRLLAFLGMDAAGLTRTGVLAGIYVAAAGLRPMLYVPADRNLGLYRLALSLVVALAAMGVGTLMVIVLRFTAPAGDADGFWRGMIPLIAAAVTLAVGWVASRLASRRRERVAEAYRELEERVRSGS